MSAFHTQPAWKALRLAAKRRDDWRCVRCGSRVGLEVDHIQPRHRHPDLALCLDNVQTLCKRHHIEKTQAECAPQDVERVKWLSAISALSRR